MMTHSTLQAATATAAIQQLQINRQHSDDKGMVTCGAGHSLYALLLLCTLSAARLFMHHSAGNTHQLPTQISQGGAASLAP